MATVVEHPQLYARRRHCPHGTGDNYMGWAGVKNTYKFLDRCSRQYQ